MKRIIIDGIEWYKNKYGVIFRYGNEDLIKEYLNKRYEHTEFKIEVV